MIQGFAEFNIRMDGFITNSDMYGYPASHFSLPMEAVERIELVRGLRGRLRPERAAERPERDRAGRHENVRVDGNRVQSVPYWIARNGLTLRSARFSGTLVHSYTGETYADALNTRTPSSNGAVGLVPSYGILDLSASYEISSRLHLRASINNLTDERYYTKRPEFYPGPGIWPSDGRSVYLPVGVTL